MIVMLAEEASFRDVIAPLIKREFPSLAEGIHWQIINFQGKADLEKNFSHKMRSWSHLSPHFIILRDNDGTDCAVLKQHLHERARTAGKPFNIRLVCQGLESWLLGDLCAIEAAHPSTKANRLKKIAKFRDPDSLTNASQELVKLTGSSGKLSNARLIVPHLNSSTNTSHSFHIFWNTLAKHFPRH